MLQHDDNAIADFFFTHKLFTKSSLQATFSFNPTCAFENDEDTHMHTHYGTVWYGMVQYGKLVV